MEDKLLAAAALLYGASAALAVIEEQKESHKKREWVKAWRRRRASAGSYKFLTEELRLEDKSAYREYLRMDENCFEEILGLVAGDIRRKNTFMRDAISPEEKLSITLRFLATGETYRSLDFQSRLSQSFLTHAIPDTCHFIYERMKAKYLKFPENVDDWLAVAKCFEARWQFPHCIGALDGKHIAFRASKKDGALYYNYKSFNSIVLLALCDAEYIFTYVDVGCNGRISDGGVFSRSDLKTVVLNANKYLPSDDYIGNHRLLPYVIIGDDAFALETHVLKPYPYHTAEKAKKVFNYRLSFARQTIEHSFGILANRYRVLQTQIHLRPEKVRKIVLACCVLHNYLIMQKTDYMSPINAINTIISTDNDVNNKATIPKNFSAIAGSIRNQYAEYFSEEGSIPWQESYI